MRVQVFLFLLFALAPLIIYSVPLTNVRQPEHEDKRELLEDLLNQFKGLVFPSRKLNYLLV